MYCSGLARSSSPSDQPPLHPSICLGGTRGPWAPAHADLPGALPRLLLAAGTLFVERGTIVTVFIICYALTSFVGG